MTSDAALTISFDHTIHYSTKSPVPAQDIAESLLALDRLIQRAPNALRALVPGIAAPQIELFVRDLHSGSLTEEFVVKLFFGSKQKMNRVIKRVREKLGIDLTTDAGVIRTIIIALVIVGAGYAAHHLLSPKQAPAVEFSHNTIVNIGTPGLSGEDIVRIIDASITNKNALAKDAIKVIRPAKRDSQAEITFDDNQGFKITKETIALVPEEVPATLDEESHTKKDVEILLRATDLDNSAKGWAAIVPAITSKRLRLELHSDINSEDLFGKKSIRGTVEVIRRKNKHGKIEVRAYRLLGISPEK